jgi:hypothetical protein
MEPVTSVQIDFDDFTIAEVEQIEELSGVAFGEIGDLLKGGKPAGKVLRALAFVSLKRTNPDATLEDAGNIKLKGLFGNKTEAGMLPPPDPQPQAS